MITKRLVGLTIVGVEHRRWFNKHLQRLETTVERIKLEDGSVLVPWAFEAEDGPAATVHHYASEAKRKRRGLAGLWLLAALAAAPVAAQQRPPLFSSAADGQAYPTWAGAWGHAATKAVATAAVDVGLRKLGVPRPVAAVASTVGLFVAVKAIERARGHTLGPRDAIFDASWHLAGLTIARRQLAGTTLALGLAVVTCHHASPQPRVCR